MVNPNPIDVFLFRLINGHFSGTLDAVYLFAASPYIYLVPIAVLLLMKEKRLIPFVFLAAIASIGMADWSGNMLKGVFARTRPCHVLSGVRLLAGCTDSFSMPSNHAANIFATLTPVWFYSRRKVKYLLPAAGLLTALSRVYMGVHYPSDVAAGAVLGMAVGSLVTALFILAFRQGRSRGALIIWLTGMTLFRFYYIWYGNLNLGPDEAHYWEWSRRLSYGYYSKGPVIAYLIRAGTALFGNTEFGVRFFAPVLYLIGSLLLYELGKELFDEATGICSAALFQVVPLFSAFGVIMTIDAPSIFFWILGLYLFLKALREKKTAGWVFLGVAVGLGMLTKLTMSFFILSAFLYLATSKEERRELFSVRPYLGLLACLVLLVPLFYWNHNHNWVNFRHEAGHADIAAGFRVSPESFLQFLGSQIGVITPVLFVLMAYALIKNRALAKDEKAGRFCFWFAAPTLVFFLLKSIQGKVQANWAMDGYITGIIAVSQVIVRGFAPGRRPGSRFLMSAAAAIAVFVTAVSYYPSIIKLPPKLDPSARLRGWKQLAAEVEKNAPAGNIKPYFVFSDYYGASSELAFYLKGHPVTYCANTGRRMNQYDLWPGLDQPRLLHDNAVFVTIGASGMPGMVGDAFESCRRKTLIETEKGKRLSVFTIFTCYGFKGMRERPIRDY